MIKIMSGGHYFVTLVIQFNDGNKLVEIRIIKLSSGIVSIAKYHRTETASEIIMELIQSQTTLRNDGTASTFPSFIF